MSASLLKPVTVALVEDDERLRASLSLLIGRAEGYAIAGMYADAESALEQIPRTRPDVVLMDINLPGMSGIECVCALKVRLPSARVVMLTVYDEANRLLDSLRAGASGYLLKRAPAAKILEAITEAQLGGMPMTRQRAGKVAQYFHGLGTARSEVQQLTPREKETLAELAEGYRYKEIPFLWTRSRALSVIVAAGVRFPRRRHGIHRLLLSGAGQQDADLKAASIPIRLKKGDNELLLKLSNFLNTNHRLWAWSCVIEDEAP